MRRGILIENRIIEIITTKRSENIDLRKRLKTQEFLGTSLSSDDPKSVGIL
jgi:hypothetical protein